MRRAVTAVAAACLLGGPTVLAFFSGGYFAAAAPDRRARRLGLRPRPRADRAGAAAARRCPGGSRSAASPAMLAWSALSLAWAPLAGPALVSVQRLSLYLGALFLAIQVLRDPRLRRAVEPALARRDRDRDRLRPAGRLLPGILDLARSESAGGRLEQPITYWNAEGALAAVGVVLAARVAGDRRRRPLAARRRRGRGAAARRRPSTSRSRAVRSPSPCSASSCSSPSPRRARSSAPPPSRSRARLVAGAVAAAPARRRLARGRAGRAGARRA